MSVNEEEKEEEDDWLQRKLRPYGITVPDFDIVFAYDTVKQVKVLDRRLGLVYFAVQAAVIIYIVLVVFIIKQQYMDFEKSSGWILTKVMKPQFALNHEMMSWDVFDRITNPGESGAAFIPTRIVITRGQSQTDEYCQSPLHNCTVPEDCDIGDEMLQKKECVGGMCMRRQWCPAENPADELTSEQHFLEFNEVQLWFQTYLHYHRFQLDVSTADEQEAVHYPHRLANTYRLRDLLRMANLQAEETMENGAMMLITAVLFCELDDESCEVKIEAANVATDTGFNHVHNHVYYEDGVRKRDSYRMFGIRLMTFTTGLGRKMSFSQIVLQISQAIALLAIAELVTDQVLMYVIPEKRHYTEQKITQVGVLND